MGLCGFEPRASDSPRREPRVATGPSRGALSLREPHPGSSDSPLSQPVAASGRAPHAGLCYLALVHLPQIPKDVQAGRREMRPHGARAYHVGLSGGRSGPRSPGVTDSCGAPARPPPNGLAGHVTWDSLGRLGIVVLRVLATSVPGRNQEEENYHSQNSAGREPRPVKTQDSQRLGRPGSGASSDPYEGTSGSWWCCIWLGQLGEVTTQEQSNSPRLWSGARKTPKALGIHLAVYLGHWMTATREGGASALGQAVRTRGGV